jgi:hypothetical protein
MKVNKELKTKWPWGKTWHWPVRTKAIADVIPSQSKVIELGGGMCYLKTIRPDIEYRSIDREAWTALTTVSDFNKGEYPDLPLADVIVCQGILEYIDRPDEFLKEIHKYSRRLMISYYIGKNNIAQRKNKFSYQDLIFKLTQAKWEAVSTRKISEDEVLFLCIKFDNVI